MGSKVSDIEEDRWSNEQTFALQEAIALHGRKDWSNIARHVNSETNGHFTVVECQAKYIAIKTELSARRNSMHTKENPQTSQAKRSREVKEVTSPLHRTSPSQEMRAREITSPQQPPVTESDEGSENRDDQERRTRRPWSKEETEFLMSMVEKKGMGQWTFILDQGKKFEKIDPNRTGGDLKDKCRNVKKSLAKGIIPKELREPVDGDDDLSTPNQSRERPPPHSLPRRRHSETPNGNPASCSYLKWSPEEVRNLLKGVKNLKEGNWSAIKKAYKFHEKRTTHDLRDKYRNLQRNRKYEGDSLFPVLEAPLSQGKDSEEESTPKRSRPSPSTSSAKKLNRKTRMENSDTDKQQSVTILFKINSQGNQEKLKKIHFDAEDSIQYLLNKLGKDMKCAAKNIHATVKILKRKKPVMITSYTTVGAMAEAVGGQDEIEIIVWTDHANHHEEEAIQTAIV